MYILGIETTCDETAFSVVKDGLEIISETIFSQDKIHEIFGGVVPELASRHHVEILVPLLEETLRKANLTLHEIDRIAVAKGPGLIGSLLVGIHFAKGLAFALNKPLIGINHIEAHLFAAMMSVKQDLQNHFPALGMVLSGGHTSLIQINDIGSYKLLGQTIDDAIGEAFDKVAKMLQLPYPGGPHVEQLALQGNADAIPFKKSKIKERPLDFSFSGLKTQVLYRIRDNSDSKADIAASFQKTTCSEIVEKLRLALETYPAKALFFGGGVTRNNALRKAIEKAFSCPIFFPEKGLCVDNAAMIAGLAFYKEPYANPADLQPETRIPF